LLLFHGGAFVASNQKKVVVRRFDGTVSWGYLGQSGIMQAGKIEMMEPDGRLKSFAVHEIKTISYVRDFNLDDAVDPERVGRKAFLGRPKGDGLWLRITFRDGDHLEGLSSFGLVFLDGLLEDEGIFLTPPELRSNTMRLFIPRQAMASLEVLGALLSSPARAASRKPAGTKTAETAQTELFHE
jgi:hypothetical protein